MKNATAILARLFETGSYWIDSVVVFAGDVLGRFYSPRTIRLVEGTNGEFVIRSNSETADQNLTHACIRIVDGQVKDSGSARAADLLTDSHVELVLAPSRFIFRSLALPSRATEFVPGIVRSQIDRITPWSASEAAFGSSMPVKADADSMVVTVAATAQSLIKPFVQAIMDIGVHSVAVFTTETEAPSQTAPIQVWNEAGRTLRDTDRIRHLLVKTLAVACIATFFAVAANVGMSISLSSQQDELARQISGFRSAADFARATGVRRKSDAPSTVLAIETLSKILPDHTYVTELRVEGNKIRVTGITRDAPSLIGLIEQSGRFMHATFFAPTTRSSANTGDRFHIEAVIKPLGSTS